MGVFIKVNLRMEQKLALEYTIGQINHSMKEIGNMMSLKVKENITGVMEENT